MKLNKTLWKLGAAMLLFGGLTSCNNDLNDFKGQQSGNILGSPVVSPDVIAWSGTQTLGNSFTSTKASTRADNGNDDVITWKECRTNEIDRTDQSPIIEYINSVLKENEEYDPSQVDDNFLYYAPVTTTFHIYPVYNQTGQRHSLGIFYYTQSGEKKEYLIWDLINAGGLNWTEVVDGYSTGREITVKAGYKFGFFWLGLDENNSNLAYVPKVKENDWESGYETKSQCVFYTTSSLNTGSYRVFGNGNWSPNIDSEITKIRAVTFADEDGEHTFLGIEDWADFDYQDIIFYCPETLEKVNEDDILPKFPANSEEKDVCDRCKHPHHGDNDEIGSCEECTKPGDGCYKEDPKDETVCERCGHEHHGTNDEIGSCEECTKPGDGCYKEPGTTPTPSNPTQKPTGNEVEINLSINEIHTLPNGSNKYDIADLVSKLSIHVRYPHDVEVILPVPQSMYCDMDDMYILKDHYYTNGEPNWKYGGDKKETEFTISGSYKDEAGVEHPVTQIVKLGVEFISADQDNLTEPFSYTSKKDGSVIITGGYIRVYTDGINEEVINLLQYTNGDGINFEVYNYYNRGTMYTTGSYPEFNTEDLQYFLNHSMVNFDWNYQRDVETHPNDRVLPDYYIDAFNELNKNETTGVGSLNLNDCYTWILGDNHANYENLYKNQGVIYGSGETLKWGDGSERSFFANPYKGTHYNGSSYNWIYTLRAIGGVDSDEMDPLPWPFEQN